MMQPSMGRAASTPTSSKRFGENTPDIDAAADAASTFADTSLPEELSNPSGNCCTCSASFTNGNAGMLMTGGTDGATPSPATLPSAVALCIDPCPCGNSSTGATGRLEPCTIGGNGTPPVRAVCGNLSEDSFATTVDRRVSAAGASLMSSSVAGALLTAGRAMDVELTEVSELMWLVNLVELVVLGAGVVPIVVAAVVVATEVVADRSCICRSDMIKPAVFMSHRGAPSHADWSNQCVSPDHNVTAIVKPACIALTVFATSQSGTPEAAGYSEAGVCQDGFQPWGKLLPAEEWLYNGSTESP
mmetsp:Transcript_36254/g.69844  ORF Transcript_36254/g.69844 Transcript_36254/m.69844 type:complete len:302 (+) Transcript_36254:419-1324(+)